MFIELLFVETVCLPLRSCRSLRGAKIRKVTPVPTILDKSLTTTDNATTAAANSSHHYSSAPSYFSQLCALKWTTSGPPSMQEKSVTSITMCKLEPWALGYSRSRSVCMKAYSFCFINAVADRFGTDVEVANGGMHLNQPLVSNVTTILDLNEGKDFDSGQNAHLQIETSNNSGKGYKGKDILHILETIRRHIGSGLGSAIVEILFSAGFMLADKQAIRTDCRTTGAKLSTPNEVFGLAGGHD